MHCCLSTVVDILLLLAIYNMERTTRDVKDANWQGWDWFHSPVRAALGWTSAQCDQ